MQIKRVMFGLVLTVACGWNFHGSKISSNGGLLLFRELDEELGLHDIAGGLLRDTRTGHNRLHSLVGLLRQSVFGRLAGYDDVNDADRLSLDPVMRQVVGGRAVDAKAASSSQMGRFETEVLATSDNRTALADLSGQWIDRIHERKPPKWITLDMDSSVSPTHGAQEDTAWNGHFGCMCYHPLFVFNQFGHLERCALRPGNMHSADGWKDVLKSVMARYADRHLMRFFRGDAAFAIPDLYGCSKRRAISMPSGSAPIVFFRARLRICSSALWAVRPTMCDAPTATSNIRLRPGTNPVVSSPRWTGIRVNCSRGLVCRYQYANGGRLDHSVLQSAWHR